MLTNKPVFKDALKSITLRAIAWAVLLAVIASVSTVVVSRMLGYPAPAGVAGAMGAVCACAYFARKQRK